MSIQTIYVQQDQEGKWWADCDSDFDPNLITTCVNGVWRHDGCPCDTLAGPFLTEEEARAAWPIDEDE